MKEIKDLLDNHYGSLPILTINHLLDQVNYSERNSVFAELLKRVEIGGTVYIRGVDLVSLCVDIYRGHISEPEERFSKYKSLSRLELVENQLVEAGFSILISEKQSTNYYVVGKRNV